MGFMFRVLISLALIVALASASSRSSSASPRSNRAYVKQSSRRDQLVRSDRSFYNLHTCFPVCLPRKRKVPVRLCFPLINGSQSQRGLTIFNKTEVVFRGPNPFWQSNQQAKCNNGKYQLQLKPSGLFGAYWTITRQDTGEQWHQLAKGT